MFGQTPTLFVSVFGDQLIALDIPSSNQITWKFPPDLVQFGEVRDESAFVTQLSAFWESFFAQLPAKKAIITLDQSLLFAAHTTEPAKTSDEKLEQFLHAVPLGTEQLAYVIIDQNDQRQLYATNQVIYRSIAQSLLNHQVQVPSILPIPELSQLSPADVAQNWKKFNEANFLNARNANLSNLSLATGNSWSSGTLLLFALLILTVFVGSIAAVYALRQFNVL